MGFFDLKKKFITLTIISIVCCSNKVQQENKVDDYTVKGLAVFIRHGARVPVLEDYYEDQWDGLKKGELTETGQGQLESLGKKMRKIYIDDKQILPEQFDKSFIEVKFAFISRCLTSLLGFLKGLYPEIYDHKEQVNHEELLNPSKDLGFSFDFNDYAEFQRDLLFRANDKKNCEVMKHIQAKKLNSPKFQAIFHFFRDHPQMKSIIKKLKEYRIQQDPNYDPNTEIVLENMFHIKEIYDSYLMNIKHNKPVPAWDQYDLHLLQMQYEHFFFRFFGFHEAKMIEASQLFQELFEITNVVYDQDSEKKLFIFSGTKTNIAIFISSVLTKEQIIALGDKKIAPLSAYIAFEMLQNSKGENFVRVTYGQDILELEHCKNKTLCTLQEFRILVKTKIYKNLEKICDATVDPL